MGAGGIVFINSVVLNFLWRASRLGVADTWFCVIQSGLSESCSDSRDTSLDRRPLRTASCRDSEIPSWAGVAWTIHNSSLAEMAPPWPSPFSMGSAGKVPPRPDDAREQ